MDDRGDGPGDRQGAGADTAGMLRADVDAGLRFVHMMGMQTKRDVFENTSQLYAVIEELVARGQLDLRSLEERRERIKQKETARIETQAHVQVGPPIDKYALTGTPVIDCQARIPLCKGRCCKLSFPLTFQDLDEGVVKWEYSRPYQIRKRADAYCVHSDEATRGCQVYDQRPAVCRSYDCRNDRRIWTDFEKRIPAPEEVLDAPPGPAPAP